MKVSIIGSRKIQIDSIDKYMPKGMSQLISGRAGKTGALAKRYADKNDIPKFILKPDYAKHGKSAPITTTRLIVESAELLIVFWDGVSSDTKLAIDYAKSLGTKLKLVLFDITGIEILPGNFGKDCLANGEHFDEQGKKIECCCDECDFLQCCIVGICCDCKAEYCPRKFSWTD